MKTKTAPKVTNKALMAELAHYAVPLAIIGFAVSQESSASNLAFLVAFIKSYAQLRATSPILTFIFTKSASKARKEFINNGEQDKVFLLDRAVSDANALAKDMGLKRVPEIRVHRTALLSYLIPAFAISNLLKPTIGIEKNIFSQTHTPQQIKAIMAHEVAHHALGHLPKIRLGALLAALASQIVSPPVAIAMGIGVLSLRRRFEFQADRLGAITTKRPMDLADALASLECRDATWKIDGLYKPRASLLKRIKKVRTILKKSKFPKDFKQLASILAQGLAGAFLNMGHYKMWGTHPSTNSRIMALHDMARAYEDLPSHHRHLEAEARHKRGQESSLSISNAFHRPAVNNSGPPSEEYANACTPNREFCTGCPMIRSKQWHAFARAFPEFRVKMK